MSRLLAGALAIVMAVAAGAARLQRAPFVCDVRHHEAA